MSKRLSAIARPLVSLLLLLQFAGTQNALASEPSPWSQDKTVTVGDTGTIYPALMFGTGRTELETSASDLVVEQSGSEYFVYSYVGGFVDLGKVDYAQVPLGQGDWAARIAAVPGHVYVYSGLDITAKFIVVMTAKGQVSNIPAISLRYATANYGREDLFGMPDYAEMNLPAPGGTKPTPEPPTPEPPTPVSTAPTEVTATASRDGVVISWTAPDPAPAQGYYVYRGTEVAFTPGTPLTDFPVTTTSFTDTTAQPGQTYYYIIEVVGGGRSPAVEVYVVLPPEPVTPVARVLKFKQDSLAARVDGAAKQLEVAPQIIGNRMMVPLRFLGEALGAQIGYEAATEKVTYVLDGLTLELWVGKLEARLNGQALTLDVPPMVINGRTLIPLRFVSENLGADVTFDANTLEATIAYAVKGEQPEPPDPEPDPTPVDEGDSVLGITFGIYELRSVYQGYVLRNEDPATIIASGVLNFSLIQINPDGTYVWASKWDGVVYTGTWRKFDGESILIENGQEGMDWLMTAVTDGTADDVFLYTSSVHYNGKLVSN